MSDDDRMNEIILMSDLRVAGLPVEECDEPLVDVRRDGSLLVDLRKQDPADAFALLRQDVLRRLRDAQDALPGGLRLLFVEGYRPPALQRHYFEEYAEQLRAAQPDWSDERVHTMASRYVSPPEIAPHSAGAAVDLTLADADGRELDLGTRMNADPEESAGACYTDAENITEEARANRAILGAALTAAGLVNYPTEWWHWSYGDRYWAMSTGAPAALYGPYELQGDPMRRHIPFENLHNFRDLGGYTTVDGRAVRWGRLYRSDSLGKLRDDDWDRFLELGVRTVIDLRYPWEIEKKGRVPEAPGLAYANLSVEHRPYDQAEIDPDVDPWRYLADRYAEVALDGAAELREALELIADGDGPQVFHCASGKDRTGLLAALVLRLLGVDEDTVAADFALTERATSRLVADWQTAHPTRTLRWPSYGRAPEAVIRLFLADLTETYGSVEGYVQDHLGVDDKVIARLRERLLTA